MLILICGAKGSGKTSRIIEKANADLATASGDSVFVSDTGRYVYDLDRRIIFADASEYGLRGTDALTAFLCGLVAAKTDVTNLYIDGAERITGKAPGEMEEFYARLAELAEKNSISAAVTVDAAHDDLPESLMKYKII